MPPTVKKTRNKKKGSAWGDADYEAKGFGRVTLRLPFTALQLLEKGAKEAGMGRAEYIAKLVGHPRTEPTSEEELRKLPLPKVRKKK